jgi:hypothetical protein
MEAFKGGLFEKYALIPTNSFVATQFNLRAHGTTIVSRETARKWLKGLSLPSPSHLITIIQWLKLNPSDFLAEIIAEGKIISPLIQNEISIGEKNKVCAQDILDSLSFEIAVIDSTGLIVQINKAWKKFASNNSKIEHEEAETFLASNYLKVCEAAIGSGSETAQKIASAIRNILNGTIQQFEMKYLCHSPNRKRWYVAKVAPLSVNGANYAVISHQAVSEKNYLKLEYE